MKAHLRIVSVLTIPFTLAIATLPVYAGSFALREQSARGMGVSFAGVAAGSGGLSSAFWNPATITMNPGFTTEGNLSLVVPQSSLKPDASTLDTVRFADGVARGSGNISQAGLAPASTTALQINDKLWLAIGVNAPFGFVTKPHQNWAGQIYGRSSKVFSINVNPMVAYKVSDWLSIAAGLQVQHINVSLKQATGIAYDSPSAVIKGKNTAAGYTLGITVTPVEGTTVGLGFRSTIHHELNGSLSSSPSVSIPVRAKLNLPEVLTLGISHRLNDRWTVLGGAEWTNWSRLNRIAVTDKMTGVPATFLKFEYEDGWYFSLGAEYAYSEKLNLRGGLGYEVSPIKDKVRNVRIPDANRVWASVGASYSWNEKLSFDASYAHLFVKSAPVRIVQGHPDYAGLPFVAELKPSADIVSVGLRYRWDDPKQPLSIFQ